MPIVLTSNEVVLNPDHAWNDVEGVQYHYPNQYKGKIQPGEQFVYYRGVHRADGRRAAAEYFGHGRIGAVWPDPATLGAARPAWFCAIEDYVPFTPPVAAKPNGVFYETIPSNMWRSGVRSLDKTTFAQILAAAGLTAAAELTVDRAPVAAPSPRPPQESASLILPARRAPSDATAAAPPAGGRRSRQAKQVGDWAEQAALAFIRAELAPLALTHRAAAGETPGWDIDYLDADGRLQRVEVKGTVGAAFASLELTAGELRAAQAHGEAYWLYLVAHCLTDRPRLQRIRHPAARLAAGDWTASPALFTVRLS